MFKLYDWSNARDALSELSKPRRVNIYIAAFEFIMAVFLARVLDSGLESWQEWGGVIAVFIGFVFTIGLIDANIPQGATYLWPKAWCIRNKQIWPRQKH